VPADDGGGGDGGSDGDSGGSLLLVSRVGGGRRTRYVPKHASRKQAFSRTRTMTWSPLLSSPGLRSRGG
jgi:hypothetical protein